MQKHNHTNVPRLPLGITMLMEDGHAASMKSRSRGLRRCRTGSSCLMEEIHMDMGRSCACFFTLESNMRMRLHRPAKIDYYKLCYYYDNVVLLVSFYHSFRPVASSHQHIHGVSRHSTYAAIFHDFCGYLKYGKRNEMHFLLASKAAVQQKVTLTCDLLHGQGLEGWKVRTDICTSPDPTQLN